MKFDKTRFLQLKQFSQKYIFHLNPDVIINSDAIYKMYEIAVLNAAQISKKISDILFNKNSIKVVKN